MADSKETRIARLYERVEIAYDIALTASCLSYKTLDQESQDLLHVAVDALSEFLGKGDVFTTPATRLVAALETETELKERMANHV